MELYCCHDINRQSQCVCLSIAHHVHLETSMKIFFLQRFWPLLSCCCVTAVSSASLSGKYEDALLQQGVSPGSRPLPHDIEHVQDHTKETIPLKRTGHQNLYGTTPEPTDTAPAQVDIEEEFGPAAQHSGRPSPPWDAPGGPPVRPAWLLALGLAAVLLLLLAGLCPVSGTTVSFCVEVLY